MNKLLKILLISATMVSFNVFAETVYVNGKAVDQKFIDKTIEQFKKSSPMASSQMDNPQFKKQILQSIGMQQAILAEGNKDKLDKTAKYQEKLDEIKPMIYAQLLQDKASGAVTEAEVLAKYNELKATSAKQKNFKAAHILVKDQKTADKVLAELKKGAKFSDLAKKYSTDSMTKDKGGELGWSDGSGYVPEFTKALSLLHKGQYTTSAVKTQFGYHIIKVEDEKSGPMTPMGSFDSMKEQLKQQVQMEKTRQFFDGLKAKYKIEVK
jgi:peptidyl-prolyl cis-trans isomerase C